uniref:V-SNARE coiled-coil homology domain-containing protein n=1 Tax=Hucho hucho TaxID=62062 RepID=A0A4W5MMK9_9TELE
MTCVSLNPLCCPSPRAAPAPEGSAPGTRRLQQTQTQVDEVVDIMRVNVDKVLERDSKLSELDDRADALSSSSSWPSSSVSIVLGGTVWVIRASTALGIKVRTRSLCLSVGRFPLAQVYWTSCVAMSWKRQLQELFQRRVDYSIGQPSLLPKL